jgi:hypothetical protein
MDYFEHFLVHRVPQPVLYAYNLHRDLFEVSLIASPEQPAAELIGERLAELEVPLPPLEPLCGSTVADVYAVCGQQSTLGSKALRSTGHSCKLIEHGLRLAHQRPREKRPKQCDGYQNRDELQNLRQRLVLNLGHCLQQPNNQPYARCNGEYWP